MEDTTTDDARPPKRRKIRLACQECRDKKTRCDGGRPVCNACIRKKLGPDQCVYFDGHPDLDAQYVKALEGRIRELERVREPSFSAGQPLASPLNHDASRRELPPPPPRLDQPAQALDHPTPAVSNGSGASVNDSHAAAVQLMDLQSQGNPQVPGRLDPPSVDRFVGTPAPGTGSMGHPMDGQRAPSVYDQGSSYRHSISSMPPHGHLGSNEQDYEKRIHEQLQGTPGEGGDVMGAAEGTPTDSGRTVFLGPSSAAAFMREVQESSGKGRTYPFGTDDAESSATSRASHFRSKKAQDELTDLLDSLTLPPRRIADAHLEKYWERSHPLYPILHKTTFMKRYDAIWNQGYGDQNEPHLFDDNVHAVRAFHAALNIILALGCIYSYALGGASSKKSAETFYKRSQALLKDADFDHGNLQLVQALILTAQYLQTTDMVNKCWVTVGTSIRVAQGIGIQLDLPSESQAEREERKRTWWCCLLLDRVLSMTFGRPPMVTWATSVQKPEPIDDDLLSEQVGSCSQPLNMRQPSTLAFFPQTLKLTDVLMSVLKNLYRPPDEIRKEPLGDTQITDLTLIVEIDTELSRWRQQLPDHLIYQPGEATENSSSIFLRQAALLHCRYLHLRILLFRPITMELSSSSFLELKASGRCTDFQYSAFTGCISSCVWAAQELVGIIQSPQHAWIIPPWWYSIFYLYTAGTVLLSVLISPNLRQLHANSIEGLESTLVQAMETLAGYEKQGSTFARQCRRILQTVNSQRHRFHAPQIHVAGAEGYDDGTNNGTQTFAGDGNVQHLSGMEQAQVLLGESDLSDIWWPAGGHDWLNSLPEEAHSMVGSYGYPGQQ